MRFREKFLVCGTLMLVFASVSGAHAQNRRPMVPQQQREPAHGNGTIKGPAGGGMEVEGSQGERFIVFLEGQPQQQQIEYVGSAEVSWLHPGLIVRFSTVVDKRGRMTEPVAHFDVITLREGYVLGVVSDSGFAGNNAEGAGLFQDAKPEKPERPARKAPVPENMPVTVIGRLTDIKNGKFQVSIPGKSLRGEVAEGAKVSIDYGNLSLVRAGDKIDFQGWSPAGMKQQVFANRITVTATEKLVGETKKKPRGAPTTEPKEAPEEKGDAQATGKEEAGKEKPAQDKPATNKPEEDKPE